MHDFMRLLLQIRESKWTMELVVDQSLLLKPNPESAVKQQFNDLTNLNGLKTIVLW